MSLISLPVRSVCAVLIWGFFQTFCSVHVLLLQQKSGRVVAFFAGSGRVFPKNLEIKAWILECRNAEHQNYQTCPGTENCYCIVTCITAFFSFFFF